LVNLQANPIDNANFHWHFALVMQDEMTIRVFKGGDDFCALLGPDLMAGEAAFGDSPSSALRALAGALEVSETGSEERQLSDEGS
jgi:hypothetical protein